MQILDMSRQAAYAALISQPLLIILPDVPQRKSPAVNGSGPSPDDARSISS